MPYLHVKTNVPLDEEGRKDLVLKASTMIAGAIGKPEQYVMAHVASNPALAMGGSLEPAAYVACKSIGLAQDRCPDLSRAICEFLEAELGVPPERTYIDFADLERGRFGWNKGTF